MISHCIIIDRACVCVCVCAVRVVFFLFSLTEQITSLIGVMQCTMIAIYWILSAHFYCANKIVYAAQTHSYARHRNDIASHLPVILIWILVFHFCVFQDKSKSIYFGYLLLRREKKTTTSTTKKVPPIENCFNFNFNSMSRVCPQFGYHFDFIIECVNEPHCESVRILFQRCKRQVHTIYYYIVMIYSLNWRFLTFDWFEFLNRRKKNQPSIELFRYKCYSFFLQDHFRSILDELWFKDEIKGQ